MPMESASGSSRPEGFPAGLRVLVVDDDPTWLKILEKMLRKCSYEVTTCCLAREALDILRERKDKFDIVISDVNMPDMDGFKLLEHVGLEMDLPVIMMSVDGETSRVMKGVQHGACDYLLKPVRMKELRNIWQHVYRKKIHELKEIESHDSNEDIHILRNGLEDFDERQVFGGSDVSSVRKRKDVDHKEHADQDCSDPAAVKKARVVWSVDLHQKFVNAVNQIGFDKVGPKKILDLMNVPGLTRENVASHLQKYRLYLSRILKQNEANTFGGNVQSDFRSKDHPQSLGAETSIAMQLSCAAGRYEEKTFGGNMHSDFCSEDLPANFDFQSSLSTQQSSVANRHMCTTQNIQAQSMIPDIQVDNVKTVVSVQVTDSTNSITSDIPDSHQVNCVPQLGVVLSFKGMKPNVDKKPFETPISKHQPWNGNIPVMQFMQYPKNNLEHYNLSEEYLGLPQPGQENEIVDHFHSPPAVISITCNSERDMTPPSQSKPISVDCRTSHVRTVAPIACKIDSVTVQVEHGMVNSQEFGPACEKNRSTSMKDLYFDQPSNCSLISPSQETSVKMGTDLVSLPEDLYLYSLQGYGCFENIDFNGMEVFEYNDSTSVTEVHGDMYDGLGFNCEYLYDSMEYPLVDDCLFT